jgi:glycosyltransferase involved in cell wall biosynthesis
LGEILQSQRETLMRRLIYLSWPAHEISGGIKMAFRHVESLRAAGFNAAIATPDGKPPNWFETTAPVLGLAELSQETDVLVFPENHNPMLEHFAGWPNHKVVFCQNQHMIQRGLGNRRDYAAFGVRDLICPGPTAAYFCRRRFPTVSIFLVPYPVDTTLFRPQPVKRLQIAYVPRKRPAEVVVINDLFRAENPQWAGIPWVQIANVPEAEVARILSESALYLSLCRFEAFPLTLMEALASGCVTAGFAGIGGRDMATTGNGFWAAEDDCLDCVDQLNKAVRLAVEGGGRLQELVETAVRTAGMYGRERFVARLTACWKELAPDALAGA